MAIVWVAGGAKAVVEVRLDEADRRTIALEIRLSRLEDDRLPGVERFAGLERQIALLTAEVAMLKGSIEATRGR